MVRRRELLDVAGGILGSFNSRNNDVAGYWGIGKLYKSASDAGTPEVAIDLLQGKISLDTDEFRLLMSGYHEMLRRLLRNRSIPESWISIVRVEIRFDVECDERFHAFRSALGRPYICKLTITDDHAREHSVSKGGNCLPHDPRRESRSNRAVCT